MKQVPLSQNEGVQSELPFSKLSPDNPLRNCVEELGALYYLIQCRYDHSKELSDRRIVLHHLKKLMVAMCAPTQDEIFDKEGKYLNPKTEQYMEEAKQLFAEDAIS